jgi:hypothetical protein
MCEFTQLVEGEMLIIRRFFVCYDDPVSRYHGGSSLREREEEVRFDLNLAVSKGPSVPLVLQAISSTISKLPQRALGFGGFCLKVTARIVLPCSASKPKLM